MSFKLTLYQRLLRLNGTDDASFNSCLNNPYVLRTIVESMMLDKSHSDVLLYEAQVLRERINSNLTKEQLEWEATKARKTFTQATPQTAGRTTGAATTNGSPGSRRATDSKSSTTGTTEPSSPAKSRYKAKSNKPSGASSDCSAAAASAPTSRPSSFASTHESSPSPPSTTQVWDGEEPF